MRHGLNYDSHTSKNPGDLLSVSSSESRDREFLQTMTEDPGSSTTLDIGNRTGMRPNAVGNYRTRLMTLAQSKHPATVA